MLLGGIIGLAAYNFFLVPLKKQTDASQIYEMRSSNEPQTAFEENRRNVDKSPAEALTRFAADPRDAEDFFLLGRAHLLLGHYPEARMAFGEAQNKIRSGDVEPVNAKTIETEIAIEMAVTSDTTIQSILKKNLDSSLQASNANANANANTSGNVNINTNAKTNANR